MFHLLKHVALFLLIVLAFGVEVVAQSSQIRDAVKEDIYLDPNLSDSEIANVVIEIGRRELRRLSNRTRHFDEVEILRRDSLHLALAPITNFKLNSRPGLSTDAESRTLRDLVFDSEIANSVLGAIGESGMAEIISNRVVSSAMGSLRGSAAPNSPNILILEKKIAIHLEITVQQQEKICRTINNNREDLEYGGKYLRNTFDTLYQNHEYELQNVLTKKQADSIVKLCGEPIRWYRSSQKIKLCDIDFSAPGHSSSSSTADRVALRLNKSPFSLSALEAEENGLVYVHGHLHRIIKDPFSHLLLELIEDQDKELVKAYSEINSDRGVVVDMKAKERLIEIVLAKKSPVIFDNLGEVLLPHQIESLKQIEFQVLTGENRHSFGILDPVVAKMLKLSRQQKTEIQILAVEFEQSLTALEKQLSKDRKDTKEKVIKRIGEILTGEQKEKLAKLTGKSTFE